MDREGRTGTVTFKNDPGPDTAWEARVQVLHLHGQQAPSRPILLSEEVTVLGRAGGDAPPGQGLLELADPHVSSRHASLIRLQRTISLRHDKERNSTYINQEPARLGVVTLLSDGDVLRVGATAFLLVRCGAPAPPRSPALPGLLGASPGMAALREALCRVGAMDDPVPPVLLQGDNGTGKELAARALHDLYAARGRRGAFVAVNCGAIPEGLIESELFGHRRGAFTGADTDRKGAFVAADGGTLFLDEVAELPRPVQAKLLRALQEMRVKPLGEERERPVDVRVVAATHRALLAEVQADRFRQDLFYRLAKLVIELPPLRARREDILPLLAHFLLCPDGALPPLHPDLVAFLLCHDYPGNVRELSSLADRLRLHLKSLAPGEALSLVHLGRVSGALPAVAAAAPAAPEPTRGSKKPRPRGAPMPPIEELRRLLDLHDGQIAKVAREIGEDRKTLRTYLRKLGLYHGPQQDDG